jgi:DNA-binding GntR family transcriptional regulator
LEVSLPLQKIRNKTLRQTVYEQLRESIITSELPPGQTISLRNLADSMGVSPMPVREALLQLESEKIVVINSNKSIRVNELSHKDIEEIVKIRISLETMICEIACDIRPESELTELRRIVDDMWDSAADIKKYLKLNYEFHFGMYELADSPILLSLIDSLWARIGPYFLQVLDPEHVRSTDNHIHEKMLEALIKRDKKLMKETITTGWREMYGRILSFLTEKTNDTAQLFRKEN